MAQKSAVTLRTAFGRGTVSRPGWFARILTLMAVRRTRIDLGQLSDDQLHDIGLSREEVEKEIARPIWDVPQNWRRN